MTITIQIGNTDDKLPQSIWAHYVAAMKLKVETICDQVHFFGGSETYAPWQNACWVVECRAECRSELMNAICHVRTSFAQESVAVTCGETDFV